MVFKRESLLKVDGATKVQLQDPQLRETKKLAYPHHVDDIERPIQV